MSVWVWVWVHSLILYVHINKLQQMIHLAGANMIVGITLKKVHL